MEARCVRPTVRAGRAPQDGGSAFPSCSNMMALGILGCLAGGRCQSAGAIYFPMGDLIFFVD
jgi:hypothetical protein